MKSVLLGLFLFLFFAQIIHAQKFGDISDEQLKMTTLSEDPEEDAVILFDKAVMKINPDFKVITKRHVRIKVLKEEGKKQANVEFVVWYKDNVGDIEAISKSPDGKEYELDDDNIFKEKSEYSKKYSFPVPGVEVGSVFEYRYTIISEFISHLDPWYFQNDIYTKYSELKIFLANGYTYRRLSRSLNKYDYDETREEAFDKDFPGEKIAAFTFTCKDLPGIKDESFTDNITDNYAQMRFVLVGFRNQYVNYTFVETWDDVAKRIYKFYDDIMDDDDVEEITQKIIGDETDPEKKAIRVYEFVRAKIKTNSHNSLMSDSFKEPEEVLKNMSGSSSEKSLLLINMLRSAGFFAKPVWISTRKNGMINGDYTDATQFNRMICYLQIGDKSYFLYPVTNNPFGYLTPSTDVANGLLISKDNGLIINLKPANPVSSININSTASINEENTLNVNSNIRYTGYAALDERDELSEKQHDTYVKDMLKKNFPEAVLDTFYYENIDSINFQLALNLKYHIENYCDTTGAYTVFIFHFLQALKIILLQELDVSIQLILAILF